MFLLRTGPGVVTLQTSDPVTCCSRLGELPGAEECSFHDGFNRATDENTLCIVETDRAGNGMDFSPRSRVFVLGEDIASFLVDFLAEGGVGEGLGCRPVLGPTIILMRSTGNREAMLSRLLKRFNGTRIDFNSALAAGDRNHSLLALTQNRLSQSVGEEDIFHSTLLIPQPGVRVLDSLRSEALVYITETLESHEWYELRINIFDSSERYDLHYRRLRTVLSALDLGMILGERWTEDHALALMSVLAFQVRLFTLSEPSEVKSVLVGLEYDDEGNRLVDMDLYYRNRKVTWASADEQAKSTKRRRGLFGLGGGPAKPDKQEQGIQCRTSLVQALPQEALRDLRELESQLPRTSS